MDGAYTVHYTPSDVRNQFVSVQIKGTNVADRPYYAKIKTSSSGSSSPYLFNSVVLTRKLGPVPSTSEAYGPGLQEAIGDRRNQPKNFQVPEQNGNQVHPFRGECRLEG
jgi:hypothetical protein